MSITFYAAPQSSASPVACALRELAVPHERINLNLAAGDQRKPEYLALNPNGKVPLLVVNGTPMFEAIAIMQWLGDKYGVEKGLWPSADSPARLEAQGLLGLLDTRVSQRPYLLGSQFSLADLILASVINYGKLCGAPTDGHANLQRWHERVLSRPSMQDPWA
jgi:glutathione S-transferase